MGDCSEKRIPQRRTPDVAPSLVFEILIYEINLSFIRSFAFRLISGSTKVALTYKGKFMTVAQRSLNAYLCDAAFEFIRRDLDVLSLRFVKR